MPARKYAWEDWFGRDRTILLHGLHYDCSQSTMVQTIRNNASMRGVRVRIRDGGDNIVIEVADKAKEEEGIVDGPIHDPDTATVPG